MNIQDIKEKVHSVCKHISDTDSGIWHTPEWNICSHLRGLLSEAFTEYNVDVELIKHDRRRPDIVIHKRGDNSDNLIVFQTKKDPGTKDLQEDLDKIQQTFFKNPYCYKFGILLSIGKLPDVLPDFDKNKISIIEVHGWRLDESQSQSDISL